jgi:hypothetical protein
MTRAMIDSAPARCDRIQAEDADREMGRRQVALAELAYHRHVSKQLELERSVRRGDA